MRTPALVALLVAVVFLPGAAGQLQISLNQPTGSGSLEIFNSGLTIGNEYYNLFTVNEACPGGQGSGPFLGLCTNDLGFLIAQVMAPVGVWPFHFVVPPWNTMNTSSWVIPAGVPAGLTIETVAFEVDTMGGIVEVSPVASLTTT